MPCGKRPLVKNWDKPRNIRVITPSRYEQNEASVKAHWKKVTRDLELSYKDDQFWESQCETVRGLVGPVIFQRIAKIFTLPPEASTYEPQSEASSLMPSELFYQTKTTAEVYGSCLKKYLEPKVHSETFSTAEHMWDMHGGAECYNPHTRETYSISDFELSLEEEELQEEQSDQWSESSVEQSLEQKKSSRFKSIGRMKSISVKSLSRRSKSKSFSRFMSKSMMKSYSGRIKSIQSELLSLEESAHTDDDMEVHPSIKMKRRGIPYRFTKNPHFDMLYCNESETDMIKWNSKYKQKTFEVSASDEFSKKAEIMTKMISKEFYDWWVGLGNVEFKSEIKRPEDIEDLFQVWFNEHASRGLVLHPKILPCVLKSVAEYVKVPKTACSNVLKRQIANDIHAETSPAHDMAFGTCLPQKMKHIPPQNNTEKMWNCVKIPEDLRSMACVWEDVQHLTSTKAFHQWLRQRQHLPMPQCFKAIDAAGEKKQLFVVPSDYVVKDKSASSSAQDLALPVSQFSLELKEVLSKLMNQ